MPATSVLAMIEQGSKVYTAIFKRLYLSMKEEFKLIYQLDGIYLDEQEYIAFFDWQPDPKPEDMPDEVYQQYIQARTPSIADFEDESMDIVPQADPRMATDVQRMAQAQLLREDIPLPWVNGPAITMETWRIAGVLEPEKYIKPPSNTPTPEQLEKLAEIEIDKKDAETRRIKAIGDTAEKLAKADAAGANTLLNFAELGIVKDELENAENERRPVPGLEGQQ